MKIKKEKNNESDQFQIHFIIKKPVTRIFPSLFIFFILLFNDFSEIDVDYFRRLLYLSVDLVAIYADRIGQS